MTENSEQNRSEPPTDFKLRRARKEGQVARSTELGFLSVLAVLTAFTWFFGSQIFTALSHGLAIGLVGTQADVSTMSGFLNAAAGILRPLTSYAMLFLVILFCIVVLAEFVQTGPVFSTKPLQMNFGNLSPAKGLKRLFSLKILYETLKATIKLAAYFALTLLIAYNVMRDSPSLESSDTLQLMLGDRILLLMQLVLLTALLIVIIDQIYSRQSFTKQMRMSHREIRREHKDKEGDPRTRQKRKELHREFSVNRRNLSGIKSADLVLVNPVHFAVALRYRAEQQDAPVVVARGSHALARRLKSLAFAYDIPIIPSPRLARDLFRSCALDAEIPSAFYASVAEHYNALRKQVPDSDAV